MQLDLWKSMVFKSSRKKLIAIGCSYTEHNLTSVHSPDVDWNFPRWPELLAEKLDMDCVNLAMSGGGNNYILSKILDTHLHQKDIGLVVVMWTKYQRLDFELEEGRWRTITQPYNIKGTKKYITPHSITRSALRCFVFAEKLLKNIPTIYIQGPRPELSLNTHYGPLMKLEDKKNAANSFINSQYFEYLEKNMSPKFIHWPGFKELGGMCVDDILDKLDPTKRKLRISCYDYHPNEDGHKVMYEKIYDEYGRRGL